MGKLDLIRPVVDPAMRRNRAADVPSPGTAVLREWSGRGLKHSSRGETGSVTGAMHVVAGFVLDDRCEGAFAWGGTTGSPLPEEQRSLASGPPQQPADSWGAL